MSGFDNILIISKDMENDAVFAELSPQFGVQVRLAGFKNGRLQIPGDRAPDALVLNLPDSDTRRRQKLAEAVGQHFHPQSFPVLSVGPCERDDIQLLAKHLTPAQILFRAQNAMRRHQVSREIDLRRKTLKSLGASIPQKLATSNLGKTRVLFVGEATPDVLPLVHSFKHSDIEFLAAFTSFTAFDFLNDFEFDAVIINARMDIETPKAIARTMRRNSRLHHVPVFLLSDTSLSRVKPEIFREGIIDILTQKLDDEALNTRVINEILGYRKTRILRHELKALPGPEHRNPSTGLFTPKFFQSHMTTSIPWFREQNRPFSLAQIQLIPPHRLDRFSETYLAACRQAGTLISSLVRAEDYAVATGRDSFLVGLPGMDTGRAGKALQRLTEVIEHTGCENLPGQRSFTLKTRSALVTLEPGEKGSAFMKRLQTQFAQRNRSAI